MSNISNLSPGMCLEAQSRRNPIGGHFMLQSLLCTLHSHKLKMKDLEMKEIFPVCSYDVKTQISLV
jgi:hypothetical protein